jgi:hypothetical protein
MPIIEIAKIQVRRGQELQTGNIAQWTTATLAAGEFAWAEDTQNLYIGKSMDEGANSDNPTRILTENDLSTVFQLASAGVSLNTSTAYRYKASLPIGTGINELLSTTSSYSTKLDNWVSLTDFAPNGMLPSDITNVLQNAIGIVTNGNTGGGVVFGQPFSSAIKIPAGTWNINTTTDLPPYTKLIGEGIGMTNLVFIGENTGEPMFQTVDAYGNSYILGMYPDGGYNATNIQLKDMSISYSQGYLPSSPLLSLDNVQYVNIENVAFNATTSTYGFSVGIRIQNNIPSNGVDPFFVATKNINIENCVFDGLSCGIYNAALSTVTNITVKNNQFYSLVNGLLSYTLGPTSASLNAVIDSNSFESILGSALVIGTSTNVQVSSVVSSNNSFRNVGNGPSGGETNQTGPVVTFNDIGSQSVNDYFERQYTTPSNVYHYPWVSGNATVSSGATQQVTIAPDATTTIFNLPLANSKQMLTVNYKLSNADMYRAGQLILNASTPGNISASDGYASVSDYYNYTEYDPGSTERIVFTTDMTHSQSPFVASTSGTNVTWNGTSTFTFSELSDVNITGYSYYNRELTTTGTIFQGVNSDITSSFIYIGTSTNMIPITSVVHTGTDYILTFTTSTPVQVYSTSIVNVLLKPGYFQNYASLVCQSIDSNPTQLEYNITLLN